ncbi:TetR/AcrR family transcriptional regulator C-terminal domain-containing protein [Eubacteriaceae bacterium ES3]|nr:TetR/AcrR family transcriptional regulator C-terminal domain-containing protein [Eubacteriaceae bacterium ES3]
MSDSSITKIAIAEAFKFLLKSKTPEKITISEITAHCGLNRQTFYYHFQDKYDLINWIVYHEGILVIKEGLTIENWDHKVFDLLSIMKNDHLFYQKTLKNTEGSEFQNYLFSVTTEIFVAMIDSIGQISTTVDKNQLKIDDQKKQFIAEFLSYGVVGMIVSWAKNGMRQSPAEITESIREIISGSKLYAASSFFQLDR